MGTVLLIEDDRDIREMERFALSFAGHHVIMAEDGIEGLRALEGTRPCVILLDLMLPRMDGLTFLSECELRGIATNVPVMCVSAAGHTMLREALRRGARECLQKPTDLDHLCERVAHYCAGHSA